MNNWISIKDRLPGKSGWYLIYYKSTICLVQYYSARHKAFNASDCLDDAPSKLTGVTHWMPLPEPPEAEGSEAE